MAREPKPVRISKTLSFLLRHRPDIGGLKLDDAGFAPVEEVALAATRLLKFEVCTTQIEEAAGGRVRRFEVLEGRIRAVSTPRPQGARPPDICYHATTQETVDRYQSQGGIFNPNGRGVFLSSNESQAWRAAHRMNGHPRLLYIDTARARRSGVRFTKNKRTGLYVAEKIPLKDALNLRPNFAEQLSAGGVPLQAGADGKLRMALIQVTRRSGTTWEVAKGKLEPGETPEAAAVREVGEEMGIDVPLEVDSTVGIIRYGFMAPGGLPRLKTVYLYLLRPLERVEQAFRPSEREGIGAVRWFTPAEAVRAVRHPSLVPLIKKARRMVEARAAG